MSRRISHEFWSRAHVSREVFEIMKALDAAAGGRLTPHDEQVLLGALDLLNAAQQGQANIGRPEVSPRWALNAWKFRSTGEARIATPEISLIPIVARLPGNDQ